MPDGPRDAHTPISAEALDKVERRAVTDPPSNGETRKAGTPPLGWDCAASLGMIMLVLKFGQAPGWLVLLGLALASGLLVRPLTWLARHRRGF